MAVLKRIFNFYISSSIHVALAVCALTWVTLFQFGFECDKDCLLFVFFASISGYNFVKYFGLAKFHHRDLAAWLKMIQVFSFIAFVAMCYYVFQLQVNTLLLILVLAVVTFLYAIPMIPKKYIYDNQKNLRQIGGLKIYVIAFVWTFTTVVLPLMEQNVLITTDIIITCLQRFLFIMALMLPFEIRDLNYDSIKLATIPQKIGVKHTKLIGVLLLLLFFLLDFFKDELTSNAIITTLTVTFVTLLFVVFSNKKQSKYYSAFWVESLPIVWLGVLLMLG